MSVTKKHKFFIGGRGNLYVIKILRRSYAFSPKEEVSEYET